MSSVTTIQTQLTPTSEDIDDNLPVREASGAGMVNAAGSSSAAEEAELAEWLGICVALRGGSGSWIRFLSMAGILGCSVKPVYENSTRCTSTWVM